MGALAGDRRRDAAFLLASVAVILVTAWPLSGMVISAWETEGAVYTLVHSVFRATGWDINLVVVVPAGVVLGWLLLFGFDQSKRIQAGILAVAAVPFAAALWARGVWFVPWLSLSPFLLLGLLVGLLSGSIDKILFGLRRREFPLAVRALYVTTLAALVVGFVDLQTTTSVPLTQTAVQAGSILVFGGLFSGFVQYTDRQDILVVTPSGHRDSETVLLCGLYDSAKTAFDTYIVSGGTELNEARAQLTHDGDVDPLSSTVEFRFKPSGPLDRWTSVTADGYDVQTLYSDEIDRALDRLRPSSSAFETLRRWLSANLPVVGGGRDLTRRLETADLVLLVVPLSDPSLSRALAGEDLEDATAPGYLERYYELCAAAGGDSNVLVVATDADRATERYARTRDTEVDLGAARPDNYGQFQFELREWLNQVVADDDAAKLPDVGERSPFPCSVVPISREHADSERNQLVANADELLEALRS